MAAAQCAGCQWGISHQGAGSKGGTDIWEGLAWWHEGNLCIHDAVMHEGKDGKDGVWNNSHNFLLSHTHTHKQKQNKSYHDNVYHDSP